VNIKTGSPARTVGTVKRPPVNLKIALSCGYKVLAKNHAP